MYRRCQGQLATSGRFQPLPTLFATSSSNEIAPSSRLRYGAIVAGPRIAAYFQPEFSAGIVVIEAPPAIWRGKNSQVSTGTRSQNILLNMPFNCWIRGFISHMKIETRWTRFCIRMRSGESFVGRWLVANWSVSGQLLR